MIRNILAVVAGLFAGMGVNMVLVLVNGMVLFPMPEGMDMNDPEQLNAYIATFCPGLARSPWAVIFWRLGGRPTRALAADGACHDRGRDLLGSRDHQHAPSRLSGLDVYRASALHRGGLVGRSHGGKAPANPGLISIPDWFIWQNQKEAPEKEANNLTSSY